MAEFKLERFKYNWKGTWASGTDYIRDDVVRVNGKSYVCLITHTASATFNVDLNAILPESDPPIPQPRWVLMTGGKSFVGEWTASTAYNVGDIVLKGALYECVDAHTSSSSFDTNIDDWTLLANGTSFSGDWEQSTTYAAGELLKYNGIVYKCITSHTSQTFLEDDADSWEVFIDGTEYVGIWTNSTVYRLNDLVKYGSSIYRCTETHTSAGPVSGPTGPTYDAEGNIIDPGTGSDQVMQLQFDHTKFQLEILGSQYDGTWESNTIYQPGDVVRHGGYIYYCLNTSQYKSPETNSDWLLLSVDIRFRETWSPSAVYYPGDLVQRGGNLYKALRDIGNDDADGSSADYLDDTLWELIIPATKWNGQWTVGTEYALGDAVYHLGTAYICNFQHVAEIENSPGDNGSGYVYWDYINIADIPGGLHDRGDLLTYGLNRTFTDDGSSLGATRVAIGEDRQLLSIQNDDEIFWRNYVFDTDVVYVNTNGRDTTGWGLSQFKPFKTVQYAARFVADNFEARTPVTIRVAGGRYEEVCPIVVPAGCVVMGDELRSTIVVANSAKEEYQNDFPYVQAYFVHLGSILDSILKNIPITPTTGNTEEQVIGEESGDSTSYMLSLLTDIKNTIDFNALSGSTNPTLTGTNDITTDFDKITSAANLLANINFIIAELTAFLEDQYPDYSFDTTRVQSDMLEFLRAVHYDTLYPGNYRSKLAGIHYANAITGSQLTDMFYMRDTTGLRNMTLDGLQGTLNPPGVFELYQRPTGGAYAALDPGWGPDDEKTWITNRSPYMQGNTCFGTSCVGLKVDGSLHNGGIKSMVTNDYTQILSDGVGAWVTNNARVELVSMFTYYCSVGYLAESGGVIRATNGNNSYGKYGSVADGNDPTETPDACTVMNRNNEATVLSGFSGASDDRIFLFEYENAGEQYTQASAEIIGAGDFVAVEYDDFRDNAVFEARLINTQGSGSEGGSNYLVRGGSAQITADASSTITISATDPTQFESEILNMRLLIVAGKGAGQYGYIAAYNNITREATIRRDSDGELGWDHVVPGTPLEADFDSTTTYRIEPKLVASHPGFTTEAYTLSTARDYVDVAYGGTTATYNNLSNDLGTGDVDGVTPIAATFRVVRAGKTYTVTNLNPGAGYAVNDTITLLGTSVGGATPANDITITVTNVTDDSTASIIDFTYAGTPRDHRLVAVADPNFVYYSDDGTTWTATNTSFADGSFTRIQAGNDRFVILSTNDNRVDFSYTGEDWTTRALPSTDDWSDITYGDGKFVIISNTSNDVLYSTTGLTYTSTSIPAGGDSTVGQWQAVEYGQGVYVAVSGSGRAVATSSDGITWTRNDDVLPVGDYDFVSLTYGNNRFVGLTVDGKIVYSVDHGTTWYSSGTMPTFAADGFVWKKLKYAQGVFFAIGDEISAGEIVATDSCATSEDGILWTERTLASNKNWSALEFTNFDNDPKWNILSGSTTFGANIVTTGARAKFRADVQSGSFANIMVWDPGSGYTSDPTITVTDTQYVTEVEIDPRIGNGVLPQPSFINRGVGYRTSSSIITVEGNGYADIIPEGNTLTLAGVNVVPSPGVQIRIDGILDETTDEPDDLKLFSGVVITDLGDDGSGNGTRLIEVTISPRLRNENNLEHGTDVTLRSRYSQCRITGHDFLDIGTGNFEQTNYPDIYAGGNYFVAAPENEVLESNGGRVFYASTDQDGNFRTGELFAVTQATGVVTISAEFFDLDGISELALGGVRLGGSGAVIREFSTDATFSEDSNNVVPTQRAIATFLADRLSVGGENLETNLLTAGTVRLGGENNVIDNSLGAENVIPVTARIEGNDAAVSGHWLATMMFYKSFESKDK